MSEKTITMTEAELQERIDREIREFAWERKVAEDEETLLAYERRLRSRMKHYTQVAEAISQGGRRNRALAVGECCLQSMEMLDKENFRHHFLPGTLSWIIGEDKAVDPDGKKGYKYTVAYHVLADEKALSDEEITKEMDETREKVMAETREMFQDVIALKEAEAPDEPEEEENDPAQE